MKRKILFLCTGNSVRSQMAEAIVNARYAEQWEAMSAGTHPTGMVHPMAIIALSEIGIEHHGISKSLDVFQGVEFAKVVTVCDAAAEDCPLWLGKGIRAHHSFPDPAKLDGNPEKQLEAFRAVRDAIFKSMTSILGVEGG